MHTNEVIKENHFYLNKMHRKPKLNNDFLALDDTFHDDLISGSIKLQYNDNLDDENRFSSKTNAVIYVTVLYVTKIL